jgi:formate C-acetyltransferase
MENRIIDIKEGVFDQFKNKKVWVDSNLTVLTDEETKHFPIAVRRAMACNLLLSTIPVEIRDYELIVGLTATGSVSLGGVFPHYALPEELEIAAKEGFSEKSTFGHHPINFEKYLRLGISGYRKRILEKLEEELQKDEGTKREDTIALYQAMLVNLDGLKAFALRYSNLAINMACREKRKKRREELFGIFRMLQRIPENPPQTLYEALQAYWLLFCALHSCNNRIPCGRIDQYFYPFYKADIENATLTREEAKVLLASWLVKFSDRVMNNYKELRTMEVIKDAGAYSTGIAPVEDDMVEAFKKVGAGAMISSLFTDDPTDDLKGMVYNSNMQNAILSGQDEAGNDVTNDMTYLILETWNELELVHPVMSVRFSTNAPEELYEACARILRKGSGEPALYNDSAIIKGLVNVGVPVEEARTYSNDGCWEAMVPGKTSFTTQMVNALQLLEFVLSRGMSRIRGGQEGFDTGDPVKFKTYEEFYEAYMEQVKRTLDVLIEKRHTNYRNVVHIAPDAFVSMFMEDCIENGREMRDGGARYDLSTPSLGGLVNVVDSLAAVKKLVFDSNVITMEELVMACAENFEGREVMRQKLIKWAPKFGNDDDYVDSIAVKLLDDCARHVEMLNKKFPGTHSSLIIGTFERAADFGAVIGATPDGRRAGDPICNNFSPMTGRDVSGPTAAVRSVTKPDLLPYYCGCPLDIQINSNEVVGEAGIKKLVALIRSFMDLGGTIFTITGVSEEILMAAKANPEDYIGLRVRLGGLSGYFVALPPAYQDMLIARTKHIV